MENIAGPRECPSAGKKFIAANKTKLGVTAKNNLSQLLMACRSLMGYLLFNFYKQRGQPLRNKKTCTWQASGWDSENYFASIQAFNLAN